MSFPAAHAATTPARFHQSGTALAHALDAVTRISASGAKPAPKTRLATMHQLSIFDALRRPPIMLPVKPNGDVVAGEVDAVYRLPHPRLAWDHARIELHRHDDGLWMWSTGFHVDQCGGGYRVGPKWGHFAETRDDALFYAASEIIGRLKDLGGREAALVRSWAEILRDSPENAKPE